MAEAGQLPARVDRRKHIRSGAVVILIRVFEAHLQTAFVPVQAEAAGVELEALAVTLRQVEAHNTQMQSDIAITRRHAL